MKAGLEVKLSAALLEKVFEGFAQKVHHHDVVHLAILSLLVAHKVEERHEGLPSELVDQLALPEEHDVSLHFDSFLLQLVNSEASAVRESQIQ